MLGTIYSCERKSSIIWYRKILKKEYGMAGPSLARIYRVSLRIHLTLIPAVCERRELKSAAASITWPRRFKRSFLVPQTLQTVADLEQNYNERRKFKRSCLSTASSWSKLSMTAFASDDLNF
jgi:hypothetical protein